MNQFTYTNPLTEAEAEYPETFSDLDQYQDPIDPLDYSCIDPTDALLLDQSFIDYLHDCEV